MATRTKKPKRRPAYRLQRKKTKSYLSRRWWKHERIPAFVSDKAHAMVFRSKEALIAAMLILPDRLHEDVNEPYGPYRIIRDME